MICVVIIFAIKGKFFEILTKGEIDMKWYAIVFNRQGVQIFKSPIFSSSEQATFWAESMMRGNPGGRYQLFQA